MRILLITEWFPPIKGAAAKRTQMMAKSLQAQGHKVTILTSFPSYPTGILPKKYHWKIWRWEKSDSLNILRVWELPIANNGTIKRILRELSFFLTSVTAAIILPVYDAVIVSSPSFSSGLSGLAARREKCKFYFDVRDLWPDSLISLGILKPGLFLDILKGLESLFYRRAHKVLVATPGIRKHLFLEGVPLNKIEVILNGANTELFKPKKVVRPAEFKPDDFVITYVGNHSRMYDLANVLKTAVILEKNSKIRFLLVGEGETKAELQDAAQKLKLSNIVFYDEKSLGEIAEILQWSNVGLIVLNGTRIAQETVPSKLAEYLASGLPVVATIGYDVKKILEKNHAGLICEPGNPQVLAKNILKLYRNKTMRQEMSKNARLLAIKMFSEKKFAEKLNKVI